MKLGRSRSAGFASLETLCALVPHLPSIWSGPNVNRRAGEPHGVLWMKAVAFTLAVPGIVAGAAPYLLDAILGDRELVIGPLRYAGWILVTAGIAGYVWCARDFVRIGRGTPAPIDAPQELVIQGLYRWSRNPMYVSVLLVVFGQAMILESLAVVAYGIVLWAAFHTFVRWYEEPRLTRQFGGLYERYRAAVPRWLGRPLDR